MSESDARPWARFSGWRRGGLLRYLSPVARLVLAVLATHTNSKGLAYPTAETIARETGYKQQLVYLALREIVELGLYRRVGRVSYQNRGGAGAWIYRMLVLSETDIEKIKATRSEWKSRRRGDMGRLPQARRASPKEGVSQHPPASPKKVVSETAPAIPHSGNRDTTPLGNRDTPFLGTHIGKEKGKEKGSTYTSHSLSLLKPRSREKNRAKDQARLVRHFEAERLNGRKLKPLAHWLKYLHPEFTLEDIEAVYKQVLEPGE